MPELHLRIDRFLLGARVEMGAVAEIVRLDDPNWFDEAASMIMVPAGEDVEPASVDLPKGTYAIQIRMPSGRIVNRRIKLMKDEDLFIQADQSSNETLSWQSYVGDVPTEREMVRRKDRSKSAMPSSPAPVVRVKPERQIRRDDLTELVGIGRKTADKLALRGIETFEQVADLRDQTLDWINRAVPGIRSNLSRYDWNGQAREIIAQQIGRATGLLDDLIVEERDEIEETQQEQPGEAPEVVLLERQEGEADGADFYDRVNQHIRSRSDGDLAGLAAKLGTGPRPLADFAYETPGVSTLSFEIRVIPGRPLEKILPVYAGEQYRLFDRAYVLVSDAGCEWLVGLPHPWLSTLRQEFVPIDLTSDVDDPARPRVTLLPRDEQLAPLIGFIRAGDTRSTLAVARAAKQSLLEKVENPYAAALGGLVLVSAMLSGEDRSRSENWHHWVSNLSDWFPWMADAHVLRGWLILLTKSDGPEAARDMFLRAASCALPVYGQSLRLLVDGLRWFRSAANEDDEVEAALKRIDLVALRQDTKSVFTTVRLSNWPRR